MALSAARAERGELGDCLVAALVPCEDPPLVWMPGSRNSPGIVTLVASGGTYMLSSRSPWFTMTW